MTDESESLTPDLDDTPCAASDCFAVADVIGAATVRIPDDVGLRPDQQVLILEVPLCIEHAHWLRMGVDACVFRSFTDQ
jgi:hypothetical protein